MAPPSTDDGPHILHLTKVPPSNSGVAHFGPAFGRTLASIGQVVPVELPLDAAETQRLSIIRRTVAQVRHTLAHEKIDLVVVHLSGRALAEYYAALAAVHHRSRPTVWIVVHDSPSLVGASMLVAPLDRRGGRRLGMAASRRLGSRLDRHVLARADAVIAFSHAGAAALADVAPAARVAAVPLPVELAPAQPKDDVVYLPAGLEAEDVEPVLAAMASPVAASWRVRVGNLGAEGTERVRAMASRHGLGDRLELTGFLDDRRLDESFTAPRIVVRNRAPSAAANRAAASGPIVQAMAAGCAVVATDPRGSADCLAAGAGIDLSDAPERLSDTLRSLLDAPSEVERLGVAARAHVEAHHVPEQVAMRLQTLWEREPSRRRGAARKHGTRRPER